MIGGTFSGTASPAPMAASSPRSVWISAWALNAGSLRSS
jgi:hypothetical protein